MRRAINTCVRLFAESFLPPAPVLEVGSRYLPGYEQLCDVRRYFPETAFVGADIRTGLGVDRIEDAHALSFTDGSVGTVLMFETLEHLADPDAAIAEAWRVLQVDGFLAISVPFTYRLHGFPTDYWRFTASGVNMLLAQFPSKLVFALGPRLKPAFVFGVAAKTSSDVSTKAFANSALRFRSQVEQTFARSRLRGYVSVIKERGRDFFGCLLGRAELTAAFFDPAQPGGYSATRAAASTLVSTSPDAVLDDAAARQPLEASLQGSGDRAQPLVSICVPTFNDGPFLLQSLHSIVKQTYPHLEILVSDDASTDGTEAIVAAVGDARIRYQRNPSNLGQFANVNRTLQRARGDYVAIYHSDDIYEPTIVEKEVAFLAANPQVGAVFTLNRRIDDAGRVLGHSRLPPGVQGRVPLDLPTVLDTLLRHKNRLLCGPSFLGRSHVFDRVGMFETSEYGIAADLEMWLRILTQFNVAVIDEPLMRYRKGGTQVSSHYNALRTSEDHFFAIMDRYLQRDDLRPPADARSLTEYAFHRCDDATFRAANLLIRGEVSAARELLRQPFPYACLRASWRRRKLRVLLLRMLLRTGIALGAPRPLTKLLTWTEYGNTLPNNFAGA